MAAKAELHVWTIYDHPLDYPDKFVARAHLIVAGGSEATWHIRTADTLEEVREQLPPGLYRLERDPSDDSKIVESWI